MRVQGTGRYSYQAANQSGPNLEHGSSSGKPQILRMKRGMQALAIHTKEEDLGHHPSNTFDDPLVS